MEIVEVTGDSYPDAHELPLKYRMLHPAATGGYKSSSSNSGTSKKNQGRLMPAGMLAQEQKLARERTAAGQKVLLIDGGKRRWVRVQG